MHHIAITNAAILNHSDYDFDLFCRCKVFLTLISVSVLPIFKEHIFQGKPFRSCFHFHLCYTGWAKKTPINLKLSYCLKSLC